MQSLAHARRFLPNLRVLNEGF